MALSNLPQLVKLEELDRLSKGSTMGKIEIVFECQGCGTCCTDLIDHSEGRDLGLAIMPDEHNLFKRDIIRPGIGFNNDLMNRFSPSYILSYQLTVNTCPYHSVENKCEIYDSRPLVCRAFPLNVQYPASKTPSIDQRCAYISNIVKPDFEGDCAFCGQNELKAFKKLLVLLVNAFHQFSSISFFDLRSNTWGPKQVIYKDRLPK
jgi:Fe-S-cluster containining protein